MDTVTSTTSRRSRSHDDQRSSCADRDMGSSSLAVLPERREIYHAMYKIALS
jgi:hypothetical protein